MRWRVTAVVVLALAAAGCAKARPPLTPTQRAFVEVPDSEMGIVEREDVMDITIPAFNPLTSAGPSDQINARFRGVDRKGPKTTIVDATRNSFTNLVDLIDTLPSDDDMRNHSPEIETTSNTRVVEERRNVRVRAWIYAIKYEADQDWHVIIGSDPSRPPKTFFNAEISGLPSSGAAARPTLLAVRKALAQMLENELPGEKYRKYQQPFAVVVEGSLFFDIDHAAGVVGPDGMRPDTAWEIHPVTKLTLQ